MNWRDKINTDVKAIWSQWSTWVLTAVLFFGDIYNEAAGLIGYADIPAPAKHAMYGLGLAGLAAKHWKQTKKGIPS